MIRGGGPEKGAGRGHLETTTLRGVKKRKAKRLRLNKGRGKTDVKFKGNSKVRCKGLRERSTRIGIVFEGNGRDK